MSSPVAEQVQLPLSMAASVVAQGIKIRLGRSLVTVTGIVLGIAFLMSILASQALRRGVAQEDRLREEANRMYGYLVAETGGVTQRALALVVTGGLSPAELRLLQRLEREKPAEVRVWSQGAELPVAAFKRLVPRRVATPGSLGEAASCLLVLGQGKLPALDFAAAVAHLRQPVVALAVARTTPPALRGYNVVQLTRELPAEERARLARTLQREHFRGLWIIAISLLVTVIGITNAMLMSVTERFRDIGTMKCLGATSRFIRRLFLLEASFMGLVGGTLGVLLGLAFSLASYLLIYDASLVFHTFVAELPAVAFASAQALLASLVLSVVAALYPAQFAARMVPADALRTNI